MGRTRLLILVIVVMLAIVEYWYLSRPDTSLPPPAASVPAVAPAGTPAPPQVVPATPAGQ